MKKNSPPLDAPTPDPAWQSGMEKAVAAFDAVASDPSWMAHPLDFPAQSHPANAPYLIFYKGGSKMGARLAGAPAQERAQIALDCQDALRELIDQLRQSVSSRTDVKGLAAQSGPWIHGADLLIESSGGSFIAGFLEGGLMRESQQEESLGFGRELDGQWMEAKESLGRNDIKRARALVDAEMDASRMLSTFLAAALPEDTHFKAGAQIGLLGHVAPCPRYPRELPVLRSMNRDGLGRLFQGSAIAMRLAEQIGASLAPMIDCGMLGGDHWDMFTQLQGGFPSKSLMLAEARTSLEALAALREAQEIAASTPSPAQSTRALAAPSL